MTIIIETPAPPVRERLVLVRERIIVPESRDATPADLERAGWVSLAAFAGPLDLLSPPTLAGALEAIAAETARAERAGDAERERDDLLVRINQAEHESRCRARERDEAYDELAALNTRGPYASAEPCGMTVRAAARARCALSGPDAQALEGALSATERERDNARAETAKIDERAKAYERDWHAAKANYARLTLVDEEEPMDAALHDAYRDAKFIRPAELPLRAVYRLGVAHERARQRPEKDRATDEELVDLYRKIYETHGGGTISVSHDDCRRAGVRAVAARVRQERCLVAQAVAANVDIRVYEDDGGGFTVDVQALGCDAELVRCVPAADVPSTLARLLGEAELLGEVSR